MVRVEVGEHQQVQPPYPVVSQKVGSNISGVVIAVPAAVHQAQKASAAHQHALPLAYVQHGDYPAPPPEAPGVQEHGQAQGGHTAAGGDNPPFLARQDGNQDQNEVHQHQPGAVIDAVGGDGREGKIGQAVHDPVEVAPQGRKGQGKQSGQFWKKHAQRTDQHPRAKQDTHRPQSQQVGQGCNEGHGLKINGREGHRKHRSSQCGTEGRYHKPGYQLDRPPEGPPLGRPEGNPSQKGRVKGLATQEDTRHRRKGELKPDVGRREGII